MTADTLSAGAARVRLTAVQRHRGTLSYVLRRVVYALIVVWAAYTITFILLWLLPSDPISLMVAAKSGGSADPHVVAQLKAQYGYDRPPIEQYFILLGNALHGDFGYSIDDGRAVLDKIAQVLPYTVRLALLGLVIGIALGVAVAVLANLSKRNWLKQILFSYAPFVGSIPAFLVGLILIQVFAFEFGWLPAAGNQTPTAIILPALSIGIQVSAEIAQVTAKAIHQNLYAPYSQFLLAKGLNTRRVLVGHALRNAIIPAFTLLGMSVGGILGGAIITETVFSRQGLGRLLGQAVTQQDIPVVQAIVIFTAILFAVSNLAVDLLYPLINPRVRVR